MGIKLDWEVESEGEWDEVNEDPSSRAERQRENRQWIGVAGGILLLIALVVGGIVWRMQQVEAQLRADLNAAIAAETAALRIGDQSAFIRAQVDSDEWRRRQLKAFMAYQRSVVATGEILALNFEMDQARVVLRETVDGEPYRVTWFYTHTDDGWRHAPPELADWSGEVQASSAQFDATYRAVDREFATALLSRLDDWWAASRDLTGVSSPVARPSVRITVDDAVGWADYDRWTLLVPSTQVRRTPEDGSLDPQMLGQLADLITLRWMELALGPVKDDAVTSTEAWTYAELSRWLRMQLAGDLPTMLAAEDEDSLSSFFTPLADTYGSQILTSLIQNMDMEEDQRLIPLLEEVTGDDASMLPVAWGPYFTHHLRLEDALIDSGRMYEVLLEYRDQERVSYDGSIVDDYPTERIAKSGTITVISVRNVGNMYYAEVQFEQYNSADQATETRITHEPFLLLEDRWVHTWLALEDWGETQSLDSRHFSLQYHELDAVHIDGLLPTLEDNYAQFAELYAFTESDDAQFRIFVSPRAHYAAANDPFLTDYPSTSSFVVMSPYVAVRYAGQSSIEYLKNETAWNLVSFLVERQIGSFPIQHPLSVAFIDWGMESAGYDPAPVLSRPLGQTRIIQGDISLDILWPDADGWGSGIFRSYTQQEYAAARDLVDYLVEVYGPESIPTLLQNLPLSTSMDDWLTRSLDITTDDIYIP